MKERTVGSVGYGFVLDRGMTLLVGSTLRKSALILYRRLQPLAVFAGRAVCCV